MKQIFTLFFFVTFSLSTVNAQLTVTPNDFESTISCATKKMFDLELTNANSGAIEVYWKVIKSSDWPAEWKTQVCDNVTCYLENFDANPASKPNILPGNSTSTGVWSLKVDPKGVAGTGKIHMEFYADSDYQTKLFTTAESSIFTADCSITSVSDIDVNNIVVFPNPTQNNFRIKGDNGVAAVSLMNIIGKEIWTKSHTPNTSYDVSNLYKGLYLVRMMDSRGKTIKTVRLNKTSI